MIIDRPVWRWLVVLSALLASLASFASRDVAAQSGDSTLDLARVIAAARRDPPSVFAAARHAEARRSELAATQHARWPVVELAVSGRYGYDYQRVDGTGPRARYAAEGGVASHAASLLARVPIFDFGRRSHAIRAAGHTAASANEELAAVQLGAASAASALFLRALAGQHLGELLEATLRDRELLAEAVAALVEQDLRPKVDLIRVQAEVSRARLELQVQREQQNAHFEALAGAMGLPRASAWNLIEVPEGALVVSTDTEQSVARALRFDPVVARARAEHARAEADHARTRSELLPELSLGTALILDRTDPLSAGATRSTTLSASAGFNVAWSALDRSRWDVVDAASGAAAASAAQVSEAKLVRRGEVLQEVYAVKMAAARLEQSDHLLATHELMVVAERQRYAVGEASLLEVLSAVEARQGVLVDRISTGLEHDTARIRLKMLTEGVNTVLRSL